MLGLRLEAGTLHALMSEPVPQRWHFAVSLLRVVLIAVAVILGVMVCAVAVLAFSSSARLYTVQTGLKMMGADLPHDERGFTNLLLLGTGDANHDGADLTDTMIVASIDPLHTRSVVMLSLPRDLFLDVNTRTAQGRINAVYALEKYRLQHEGKTEEEASAEALDALSEEIGERLGIDIHGVLKADFTAFVNMVDVVGGVDVDVQEDLTDYTYPIAEGKVGTFHIEKGVQHLDGETALKYARSRHSTNDFDRSARQQQLLTALADKVRGMSRLAQIRLIGAVQDSLTGHVETTFTREEILGLAQISMELSLERVISMQINFTSGSDYSDAAAGGFVFPAPPEQFEGASILLPIASPAGKNDWSQIKTFAQLLISYRNIYLMHPQILIQNFAKTKLEAHRLRNELLRYGWDALPIEAPEIEVAETPADSVIFYRNAETHDAAQFMGQLLSLPVAKATGEGETGTGDILLLLGTGFKHQAFQVLSGAVLPVSVE